MTDIKVLTNMSRFTELEQAVITAVLEQDISGKTNKQIIKDLGVSESVFYRTKRKPEVATEILAATKQKANMLLPMAVAKAEAMLLDPDTSDTAAVNLIKTIYQQAGLTKPEEKASSPVDNSKTLDELMASYGIKSAAHKQSV